MENIAEKKIIEIMVDGQWVVTQFTIDGADQTALFSSYRFKYHSNMTVDAVVNGTIQATGNWGGDVSTRSTWATFTGADVPLIYLNGSWLITNNTNNYVLLTQNTSAGSKFMRLDKL